MSLLPFMRLCRKGNKTRWETIGGLTISPKNAARLADKIAETLRRASICPPLGRESWTFSQPGVGVRALEAGGIPLGSWSGTGITVATYGAGSASVDKP